MAGFIETLISSSMDARAKADIEKPVAQAMANRENAEAFRAFCQAAGLNFQGKGGPNAVNAKSKADEAIDVYVKFVQATGKS